MTWTLHISPQVQARIEGDFDGPTGSPAPSGHANFDVFIRRARLLVRGTAYKQVTYAILLNAARLGERGNYNVSIVVQDVHIGYVPVSDVNVEMGLLYMPLTHAALESATDASALEIPSDILLYNNARNLRETGVQLRALFLDRRLLVRGGLYEGARNTNPPAAPACRSPSGRGFDPTPVAPYKDAAFQDVRASRTAYPCAARKICMANRSENRNRAPGRRWGSASVSACASAQSRHGCPSSAFL